MRARGSILVALAAVCALVASMVVVSGADAAYLHTYTGVSFGPGGPASGTFGSSRDITTDPATGDVYVMDDGNDTVYRFDASGKPVNFSSLGSNALTGAATPEGSFESGVTGWTEVAVDGSPGPTRGDIYVTSGSLIDVFDAGGAYLGQLTGAGSELFEYPCGVATDSGGSVYVAEVFKGVARFSPHANPVTNSDYVSSMNGTFQCEIVRDSLGDTYAYNPVTQTVTKYNASGESGGEVGSTAAGENHATALATSFVTNEVYVDHGNEIVTNDSAGAPAGPPLVTRGPSQGVGASGTNGEVYVGNSETGEVDIFDSKILADASIGEAEFASETSAVAHGSVNPDDVAVTACVFEYGPSTAYGSSVPCDPDPGSGSSPSPVTATLAGLSPGTTYHFRLAVSNANGTNYSLDQLYLAPSKPSSLEAWASAVAGDGATLSAQLNPGGVATTYRFEYGQTTAYGNTIPADGGNAGGGLRDTTVSVHAQGLQPGTTYHYRLLASNIVGTVQTADLTFTTYSSGEASGLPDGREWEMVSPPVKDGAQIDDIGSAIPGEGVQQASEDGRAVSYLATAPVGSPPGNDDLNQLLSKRGAEGWATQDIVTPNETATGLRVGEGKEYRFFSSDLLRALVEPIGETPLSAEAPSKGLTLYVRDNTRGDYRALATASNLPANVHIGEIKFSYASPDLSHVVFRNQETPNAGNDLYEWSGGHLQLVSILPNGESARHAGQYPSLGDQGNDMRNAVSADGVRIFWGSERNRHLYMRDTVKQQTIQVDAAQGVAEPEGEGNAHFQLASVDGSKVLFTDAQRLTPDSTAGQGEGQKMDLYEFDVYTGKLVDLTVDRTSGESAGVSGAVIGASEDDSLVYFVATGVLASGAVRGAPNLYVLQATGATYRTSLLATLTEDDERNATGFGGTLVYLTARVSGNGSFLAFMSDRSLTGYDNRDANSGQPDEEVYLYDAVSGKLVCASCNPSGERPSGLFNAYTKKREFDEYQIWSNRWLAASIPGWDPMEGSTGVYQPRYLSDSGRLFFDSQDGLVPRDTNGSEDVYEYEPAGVGGCERSAGCVRLISGGSSGDESVFVDASSTGDDVFFRTTSRLVSSDFDTSYDMYDAHVCGGEVSCLGEGAVAPPSCSSGDACKPAPTPQPALFGAPASATFTGAGNVTVGTVKLKVTVRQSGKARRLTVALKQCRRKPKRQRAVCEARARKRLGAKVPGVVIKRKGR